MRKSIGLAGRRMPLTFRQCGGKSGRPRGRLILPDTALVAPSLTQVTCTVPTTGSEHSYTASAGKWLELLKQIALGVTRVAVIRDAATSGMGQFGAIQAVAPSLGVEVSPVNVRDAGEIERAIAAFVGERRSDREPGPVGPRRSSQPDHHVGGRILLPAVYYARFFVMAAADPTAGLPTGTRARPATSIASSRARSR